MKPQAISVMMPKTKADIRLSLDIGSTKTEDASLHLPGSKRRRIWELSGNFHCSIIGTCLTTAELRHILVKIDPLNATRESDHQLHGRAVLLAGNRDAAAKLLQKALDRRHRSTINQFDKARNGEELRTLWDAAVQRADIPGAYWAILTHPEATENLVRHVFGEVHMLSHLVGAANRADIRRLRELEAENAALRETAARQQRHLRDAVVSRDAKIATLNDLLGKALAAQHQATAAEMSGEVERTSTAELIGDLRRRLALETGKREKADQRLQAIASACDGERKQRQAFERQERKLRQELEAAERSLTQLLSASAPEEEPLGQLSGATVLYVGGRAHHIPQLRKLAERCNATLLHHDGGIDDRSGLLEAQVARADITVFPVDCVSHNAVGAVKRVSRSLGKSYLALRSSGLASFARALRTIAVRQPTVISKELSEEPAPTA
jgi:hypothetical protein